MTVSSRNALLKAKANSHGNHLGARDRRRVATNVQLLGTSWKNNLSACRSEQSEFKILLCAVV